MRKTIKSKHQKKKKTKAKPVYNTLDELKQSRTGGQVALSGFTYQFVYSCYLLLSEADNNTMFTFEGLEDIDHYECDMKSERKTHIQLKHSESKKNASFLKDVFKNYLEVYLFDKSRDFKLVYDFDIATGNFSKLRDGNLDKESKEYWEEVINKIKQENSQWNWEGFSCDDFLGKTSFEKRAKDDLASEIEKLLIEKYDITTDNIKLYANGIKICCLQKMEKREDIGKKDLDIIIQDIKDDISKGDHNPAHNWIKAVDFSISGSTDDSYFEGKKATPQDISQKLPIRRIELEKEIEDSIRKNRITVIKASSGQGKTTIALQVSYNISHEYKIYQLTWCNDAKELNNIIKYFKSRVRLGEKPLIIVDNLDSQRAQWNRMAQLFQEEVSYNYKLLLTTREDDWYRYAGDLSNVRSLKVVTLSLKENEAKEIYGQLKNKKKLHSSIIDWKKSWEKVAERKLLIEYVYLLTHGEMISDRIGHQIAEISKADNGRIKCEILRIVCFADICGICLPVMKLIENLEEPSSSDYGELLKSVENEFLISINDKEKYVEGLHPVRSMHIVEKLHEFVTINHTAIQVIKLTDSSYLSKLFSNLPIWITNKDSLYSEIVKLLWNEESLSDYLEVLKGLLSGDITLYFEENRILFDEANENGGLLLVSTEMSPFVQFIGFDIDFSALDNLRKTMPDNSNIQYLCNLRDKVPEFVLSSTDLYQFCKALYVFLLYKNPLIDLSSYALITYWLLNIDQDFNLSSKIILEEVWCQKDRYDAATISDAMYASFCGNKSGYLGFVENKLENILLYLKHSTNSLRVTQDDERQEIHVEYILLPSNIDTGNEESVNRLKLICKTLPIYEIYSSEPISPGIDILSGIEIPNDAHKSMPIRNIVIMFNQNFSTIWRSTIMSQYECDSMLEWIERWMSIRRTLLDLFYACEVVLIKLLGRKPLGKSANKLSNIIMKVNKLLISELRYPGQDRPFEDKALVPGYFSKIKGDYFTSIQMFNQQITGLASRDPDTSRLALINLRKSKAAQHKMQDLFSDLINDQELEIDGLEKLHSLEKEGIESLARACEYYVEHEPSEYFRKYDIQSWYITKNEQLMIDSSHALGVLKDRHEIVFPCEFLTDGILKYYPIITTTLDLNDPECMIEFLYFCTPITSFGYDYLIIAVANNNGQVMAGGLRVTSKLLNELRIAIDEDDERLMEKIPPLFPEVITNEIFHCFDKKFVIATAQPSPYEGIDAIFEALWAFSKSRSILVDEEDSEYLLEILQGYRAIITGLLRDYDDKIPQKVFLQLMNTCHDVYGGSPFSDREINSWNAWLISIASAESTS